jgi:hypothetical protein
VHDSPLRDEATDFVIRDEAPPSPVCAAIGLHIDGDQDDLLKIQRLLVLGFDGHASGVMKKVPKHLRSKMMTGSILWM